jgi:hypothetical protein
MELVHGLALKVGRDARRDRRDVCPTHFWRKNRWNAWNTVGTKGTYVGVTIKFHREQNVGRGAQRDRRGACATHSQNRLKTGQRTGDKAKARGTKQEMKKTDLRPLSSFAARYDCVLIFKELGGVCSSYCICQHRFGGLDY